MNLRHVESVVGSMTAGSPALTLVRTADNTTDAIKFVDMESAAVVEEWKMAINENRFNCKQILDLSEANKVGVRASRASRACEHAEDN